MLNKPLGFTLYSLCGCPGFACEQRRPATTAGGRLHTHSSSSSDRLLYSPSPSGRSGATWLYVSSAEGDSDDSETGEAIADGGGDCTTIAPASGEEGTVTRSSAEDGLK